MKKIILTIACTVFLTGCANVNDTGAATAQPTEKLYVTSSPTEIPTQSPSVSNYELTQSQLEMLNNAITSITDESGTYIITECKELEGLGSEISLILEMETRTLNVIIYEAIKDCYIADSETGNLYYAPNNYTHELYDIYDYKTNELIKNKSDKTYEEIYQEESDRISDESDKRMDEILDKYGIELDN